MRYAHFEIRETIIKNSLFAERNTETEDRDQRWQSAVNSVQRSQFAALTKRFLHLVARITS